MRALSEVEVEQVSGGLCENMSIAQCIAGVVDQVAEECDALGGYMGSAWDAWSDFNNIGFWIYDVTHAC